MKQFIEFIPLIVFFAVYKFYDIYMATGALVVVTGLQLAYSWIRYRKVEKMQLFTFLLVGFFGGLTVFFHDDTFIKWKVTVINALFALGLLISRYGFGKNLIKQMLAKELQAPDASGIGSTSAGPVSLPSAACSISTWRSTCRRRCGSTSRCSVCWG